MEHLISHSLDHRIIYEIIYRMFYLHDIQCAFCFGTNLHFVKRTAVAFKEWIVPHCSTKITNDGYNNSLRKESTMAIMTSADWKKLFWFLIFHQPHLHRVWHWLYWYPVVITIVVAISFHYSFFSFNDLGDSE